MTIQERAIFYCKECNKLYKSCYEIDKVCMCIVCFSEDIKEIPENKIVAFIRKKRLEKLKQI